MSDEPKVLSPKELADQLFDAAFAQVQGNHREAARQVIIFLKEALVYAVSATAGDDMARKALLKSIGESIVAFAVPQAPPTASQIP
jgi:hypothetical protein